MNDRRPFIHHRLSLLLAAWPLVLSGCKSETDETPDASDTGSTTSSESATREGYPELGAACSLPNPEPTQLVFTATDDSTGAVGLVDVASKTVHADLALAQTDTALAATEGHVFVINRLMSDYVDVLDRSDDLALLSQFSVAIDGDVSSNPQDLHVTADDEAYVTLLGDDQLQVFDVSDPASVTKLRDVDFSAFSDADGTPEMGAIIPCGTVAFVAVERLDRDNGWAPVDKTHLVPLELGSDALYDWSDARDGADTVELLGLGVKSVRRDPTDDTGHVVLLLSSGLERVDLSAGTSEWVISDSTFEEQGLGRFQLRSFDVRTTDDGHELYFAVANADFSAHALYRASLDGAGADLEVVVEDLQTTTGSLEVIGNEAWFADTTVGASGIRVFDLTADPVTQVGEPLSTGLPPYALFPLP